MTWLPFARGILANPESEGVISSSKRRGRVIRESIFKKDGKMAETYQVKDVIKAIKKLEVHHEN
jgi:hypothetical protein